MTLPPALRRRARTAWLFAAVFCCHLAFSANAGDFLGPQVSPARRLELLTETAAQSSSADQLWTYLQEWNVEASNGVTAPADPPGAKTLHETPPARKAREDAASLAWQERAFRFGAACREFIRGFPAEPRSWEVRRLFLDLHFWGPTPEERRALCEQIIASTDAPPAIRDQARKLQLVTTINEEWRDPEAVEKVMLSYERDYPSDDFGSELVRVRLRYYSWAKPQDVVATLKPLTASPNKATAAAAERELALRTQPLDLRFTATDGRRVDVSKLKGRVVLLYFWATWGDPDKDILPQVLALRQKYPAGDFQVIGLCLDDNRAAMKKTIKARQMDWPNGNDTVPAHGSAVAWRFDNASPQTAWVVDRQGVAHPIPHGADLDAEIRKWMAVPS